MKKYKIKPGDEVNDIFTLHKQIWWVFYTFVGVGGKKKLEKFVQDNGGVIV
jgi:hypothetical protein